MFIMKEVGIKEEIPSMRDLDATSFGDLYWETLVDEVRKISLHLFGWEINAWFILKEAGVHWPSDLPKILDMICALHVFI